MPPGNKTTRTHTECFFGTQLCARNCSQAFTKDENSSAGQFPPPMKTSAQLLPGQCFLHVKPAVSLFANHTEVTQFPGTVEGQLL